MDVVGDGLCFVVAFCADLTNSTQYVTLVVDGATVGVDQADYPVGGIVLVGGTIVLPGFGLELFGQVAIAVVLVLGDSACVFYFAQSAYAILAVIVTVLNVFIIAWIVYFEYSVKYIVLILCADATGIGALDQVASVVVLVVCGASVWALFL